MTALDDALALAAHTSECFRMSARAARTGELEDHAIAHNYIGWVASYWLKRNETKLATAFERLALVHTGYLRMCCVVEAGHA